jgi:hypothetical protein
MSDSDTQRSAPISQRVVQWDERGCKHDAMVSIWAPMPHDDHFICEVAIDGLPEPFHQIVHGIDSLQAIILAIMAVRHYLTAHADRISFLDQRRQHGIPLIVPSIDPDEDRYIERLVGMEIEHFLDVAGRHQAREASRLATSYGLRPFEAPHELTTDELLDMLSEASGNAEGSEQDATRAYAFEERRHAIVAELRKRPGHERLLAKLSSQSPGGNKDNFSDTFTP